MNVVVTGGAGFLGPHVARAFGDHHVTLLDRHAERLRQAVALLQSEGRSVDGCVVDRPLDGDASAIPQCDVVVNCAARALTASATDPVGVARSSVGPVLACLEAVRAGRAGRLVHVSSSEVYGRVAGRYDAETPLRPVTPYGAAKAAADLLVAGWHETWPGLPVSIVRFSNLYGPGQRPYRNASVVVRFALAAVRGEPMTIYGDGAQERDFLYVGDAAAAIVALATHGGVLPAAPVLVSTGIGTSIAAIAALVACVAGTRTGVVHLPPRYVPDQARIVGVPSMISGWAGARTPLLDGIDWTVTWAREVAATHAGIEVEP